MSNDQKHHDERITPRKTAGACWLPATETPRLLNQNLGLNCEHFCLVADRRSSTCSSSCSDSITPRGLLRSRYCPRFWRWGFVAAKPGVHRTSRGRWVIKPKQAVSPTLGPT